VKSGGIDASASLPFPPGSVNSFLCADGKVWHFPPPAALPDILTLTRIYAIIMAIMRDCDAVFALGAQTVNLHTE